MVGWGNKGCAICWLPKSRHVICFTLMKTSTINLSSFLPETFNALLESKGTNFIKRAGEENVRQVVVDVLCGSNIRASTEHLTRLRIGRTNAATFMVYLCGLHAVNGSKTTSFLNE